MIDASPAGGSYAGALTLHGGWYDIEVRSLSGSTIVDNRLVERVGVGEVLVIAGQSNSANYGSPAQAAADDRVSTFDLNQWRHADDPQPIATGSGGSPWPALGDALAAELNVPIGFASVGWGGTLVEAWLPGASGPDSQPLYNRLRNALEALGPDGARAVLWHQGESDNGANTSTANYRQRLETIIAQSRIDSGFDIPWGVAQASFISLSNPSDQNIINAQVQVAANDPLTFEGAFTDDLVGPTWRASDGIHFNEQGLREHAQRWFDELIATFDFVQFTADFDSDDDVDTADLAAWSTRFGMASGAGLADGDADNDQDVDGTDFLAWQRNYGRSVSDVSVGASSKTVPEPATSLLAVIAAIGMLSGLYGWHDS